MDAALDAALEKAGIQHDLAPNDNAEAENAEKPGKTRDASGRFVSSKQTDNGSGDSDESIPADDIKAATAAAIRVSGKDKLPKGLDALLKSGDPETVAYYLKLAKVQADGDDFTKKHKQLEHELSALKKPAANSGKEKGAVDATASRPDPLASYLAEQLGDPVAAERVRESLAARENAINAELAKRDQQIETLNKHIESMAVERARDALMSEYPDLKDKGVWSKVKATFDELPESASRPDIPTRLEHAARIELAPVMAERAREERDRKNKQREQGNPAPIGRTGAAGKPNLSVGDLQDQLLDALARKDDNRAKEIKAELKTRTSA